MYYKLNDWGKKKNVGEIGNGRSKLRTYAGNRGVSLGKSATFHFLVLDSMNAIKLNFRLLHLYRMKWNVNNSDAW